jgi:hypothetical protein
MICRTIENVSGSSLANIHECVKYVATKSVYMSRLRFLVYSREFHAVSERCVLRTCCIFRTLHALLKVRSDDGGRLKIACLHVSPAAPV